MADSRIGFQCPQPDPRGVLTFSYLPPDLRKAEDETQAADMEQLQHVSETTAAWRTVAYERPATGTERYLLDHLGYTLPPRLRTRVSLAASGVRRRTFPALAAQIYATLEGS